MFFILYKTIKLFLKEGGSGCPALALAAAVTLFGRDVIFAPVCVTGLCKVKAALILLRLLFFLNQPGDFWKWGCLLFLPETVRMVPVSLCQREIVLTGTFSQEPSPSFCSARGFLLLSPFLYFKGHFKSCLLRVYKLFLSEVLEHTKLKQNRTQKQTKHKTQTKQKCEFCFWS